MCGVVNWRDAVEKPMEKATQCSTSTNNTTSTGSKSSTEVPGPLTY